MSDPVRRPTPDAVQPPDRADRSETSPPLPESLAPLLRTIRRANGFTLAFVVCGTDALERQMLDQVTAQICDRHPVRHVAAGESANDLIVDIVSPETPDQPGTVVFVTGLSALVPSDVEYPPVLALLNQLRERFTRVPATVVFWVPGYVLTRLTRQSPDFWAWRSGVFTVEAPERQSERSFESPARIVDPEDFHNRTLAEKEDDYRVLSELYDERAKRPAEDPAKQVELALRLGMLTFSLGREKESREFLEAAERLSTEHDVPDLEWQLGRIAQAQRDFAAAEQWYRKSLEIKERQGNEHGAAYSLGQLGNLYYARREFEAASQSYQRCLEISDRLGDQSSSANAYHQLGMVAQEQRDFAAAEQWYRKSLEIDERQGNEHGAAIAYHQLGIIAEEQRDFAAAELWYRKSLEINERQGNEHGAAQTYHQLGIIAQEQSDFAAAKQWYHKSLEIKERQGNEHGAASTWFQLGRIAEEQRDVAVAEQWFQRALAVYRKLNDPHHGAMVEQALARIAELKRQAAADGDGE